MKSILKVSDWRAATPSEISTFLNDKSEPKRRRSGSMLVVRSKLKPVDVYSYLRARFGNPNGIQNLLRRDDSDNWIHWDFNLKSGDQDICCSPLISGHELHGVCG